MGSDWEHLSPKRPGDAPVTSGGLLLLQSSTIWGNITGLTIPWVTLGSLNVKFYNQATLLTELNVIQLMDPRMVLVSKTINADKQEQLPGIVEWCLYPLPSIR